MNKFIQKRDSLELYIREQLIGPGSYNKRFFFLDTWESSELSGKNLKQIDAIHNIGEVISEVPAYQYSSAILFPGTKLKASVIEEEILDQLELDELERLEANVQNSPSVDDDELKEDTSESLVSKQQNYPNSFGLSFVLDKNTDFEKDLDILLSFRKYQLVEKRELVSRKIARWIPEYENEIMEAIKSYLSDNFTTVEKDSNLFVILKAEIKANQLYDLDYKYLNKFLVDNLIFTLRRFFGDELIELKNSKGTSYHGVSEAGRDIQFFSVRESISYGDNAYSNIYTLFDSSLVKYLKNKLEGDIKVYANYREIIKQIEIYKQLNDIVNSFKAMFSKNKSSPIWESKYYELPLSLSNINNSKIVRLAPVSVNAADDEIKELEYSVQYIPKGEEVFVKIILTNNFSITLGENEPPQLNKKDEANKKAFFGVQLKVNERKASCLKQYNPIQLLAFDEEENFNKLIYRNYIDYGEGYNTSVKWGKLSNGLQFISTEFLPEQETPKVDYVPSKIVNDRIEKRIINDEVLSMRFLSTLSMSSVDDKKIIRELLSFIVNYEQWIGEKNTEAVNDKDLNEKERNMLLRQLNACKNDYQRLRRNILLLEKDPEALAAFRTMNTAMFMQLHHSINRGKGLINQDTNEEYYRNIDLGAREYKWRSFQLAFVLLNIDAFVKPDKGDNTVEDIFGTGWPERNELADLVWFPTGGGKTEAYLGIIAFVIAYRRFKRGSKGYGTVALMRYTLRLLTLQQFQRATLLILAMEAIRKQCFSLPHNNSLGKEERITIGLFVGSGSLPNSWKDMQEELNKISESISTKPNRPSTNLPFTECPWCGSDLFVDSELRNVNPNHISKNYKLNGQLSICCHSDSCTFRGLGSKNLPTPDNSLPFRIFDEDIYKHPPTLLFGTVDKFAAFANNISTKTSEKNKDSRRLLGKRHQQDVLPPELIIQDELHLLLGPLGTAVGLFEKSIDYLCSYEENGIKIKPKIITSTATTRNTDKQIFALFNRRSEIFPKQGILSDDSFFAYYQRDGEDVSKYISNRKYIGVLPVGKTQVWMQLRVASAALAHRLKFLKDNFSTTEVFENEKGIEELKDVFDYYHTVLSYFNSLKDVGKTQSQLHHYLPGDLNYLIGNTTPWSFLDKLIRNENEIEYSELTGRLTGEEIKTNLADIEKTWKLFSNSDGLIGLNTDNPPEFVISTNMISVGIDVSRFNTMIISSMPRNIAEYIQASSRVARDKEGVVFTIHHPFRSRDISHYQRFKEFHEKFYSYVEPISVTPFANKALDRFLAMYAIVLIRHNIDLKLELRNNEDAINIDSDKVEKIKNMINEEILEVFENSQKLEKYLNERDCGFKSSIEGIISLIEIEDVNFKLDKLLLSWLERVDGVDSKPLLKFRAGTNNSVNEGLYIDANDDNYPNHWKVSYSLREVGPSTVIKTVQQ